MIAVRIGPDLRMAGERSILFREATRPKGHCLDDQMKKPARGGLSAST